MVFTRDECKQSEDSYAKANPFAERNKKIDKYLKGNGKENERRKSNIKCHQCKTNEKLNYDAKNSRKEEIKIKVKMVNCRSELPKSIKRN